jgi:hypothetical protein
MEPLDPNRWSMSYHFSQPYTSMNPYYNAHDLERELDLLDAIDLVVDTMTDYPEARKLLEGILK